MMGLLLAEARFAPPYAAVVKTSVRLTKHRSSDRFDP